jgi:P-type Mg2+ transporter
VGRDKHQVGAILFREGVDLQFAIGKIQTFFGPRRWDIGNITKFVLLIGPISSIFDYVTYFTMLYVFNAWSNPALFQTGWFVESLLTRTLIIHIIRTAKIPFLESRASNALIATTIIIAAIGIALPFSWLVWGIAPSLAAPAMVLY